MKISWRNTLLIAIGILIVGCGLHLMRPPKAVNANHAAFEYYGLWQLDGDRSQTIYPGSAIGFRLRGRAELKLGVLEPEDVRVRIIQDETETVYDGPARNRIPLKSGWVGSEFKVLYVAKKFRGFDVRHPHALRSKIVFEGLDLFSGSRLTRSKDIRSGPSILVIGDSIIEGVYLGGRMLSRLDSSDVQNSFAFRVVDHLKSPYRIKSHSGNSIKHIQSCFDFFQSDSPIEDAFEPDWVFINAGANDRTASEEAFREDLTALVRHVRTVHGEARVVVLNFFLTDADRKQTIQNIADLFKPKVEYFDCSPYLLGFTDDDVHPDYKSHRALAMALIDYVKMHKPMKREKS